MGKLLQPLDAMTNIGELYRHGRGVPQDSARAMEWFQKAADLGSDWAMCGIGILYADGKGVAKDDAKAMEWFKKAAALGNSWAASLVSK